MADAAGTEAAPATETVENVPADETDSSSKMAVNWADYAESDEEESEDDSEDEADAAAQREEDAWDGPRASANTLVELEEMLGQQIMNANGGTGADYDSSSSSSEDEDNGEEDTSLKLWAPTIKKVEPERQLSKKEKKRLEDEEFERELAAALDAAGLEKVAKDKEAEEKKKKQAEKTSDASSAPAESGNSNNSKKKKKNKKKKAGGGGGASAPAAATAPKTTVGAFDILHASTALVFPCQMHRIHPLHASAASMQLWHQLSVAVHHST
eukprot:m.582565 g.582565  ORF g.582565 m.582565 type:complete len:269 (+) comp22337_c1_seq17:312-1118(+)